MTVLSRHLKKRKSILIALAFFSKIIPFKLLTKKTKTEAYTGLMSVRYLEGHDLSPNILPTREACHVFVASIIMNVAKINTVAAKRLVKVQKSKNTFPPNGPSAAAASVSPSDAERLALCY